MALSDIWLTLTKGHLTSECPDGLLAVLIVQEGNHLSVATEVCGSVSLAEATNAMLVTVRLDEKYIGLSAVGRRDMLQESRS
jgi:hypothetical protein